jgi:DNA repair photolyase
VRHNGHITRGREWGGFLEVRTNAAESYRDNYEREAAWARRAPGGHFSVFCSSSTDPFVPQESRYGVTARVLGAMCELPPDMLIVQTHTHRVLNHLPVLRELSKRCDLRVHVSIESDQDSLPGLPPPASPVERRFEACAALRKTGLFTVVTVSPLLPIENPESFFGRIARAADAVVVDHFIRGDGSDDGGRTLRTALPAAMAAVNPESITLAYRDRMIDLARHCLPGRVGVNIDGFAGRYL